MSFQQGTMTMNLVSCVESVLKEVSEKSFLKKSIMFTVLCFQF